MAPTSTGSALRTSCSRPATRSRSGSSNWSPSSPINRIDAVANDGFTIGEVLNQLKEEFEDITISKIRFLESEGLIYPDRTESGYRKFTEDDVDRLRFILTAQRDHYLPLKVIREQLERLDAGDPAAPQRPEHAADGNPILDADAGQRAAEIAKILEAALAEDASLLDQSGQHVTLNLREFCEATGLDAAEVRSLRDYGIIGGEEGGGPFDADDLLSARAARDLLHLGLEPRHLRMYRQFVDRELALFEQLVTPLLRQRNPEARRQATRQLDKLASLTDRMKRSLLARALRGYVHGA
ncbi:MAG: MerR family transcriptional regulator [Nitriliruptorales bacterium]|nr:MerR family transcriptional regulator [Nitriliruptorales bacterium]